MSKDNKSMLIYSGILFLGILSTYKLPHDSYTITQYIVKPIRYGDGTFLFSGFITLLLFVIGITGFVYLDRFAKRSKILIFLLVYAIILPLMHWSVDFARTNYYWLKNDGLNAVDVEESDISLTSTDKEAIITIKLKVKDYGRNRNGFKFRVFFPASLSEVTGIKVYESQGDYITYGNRKELDIKEELTVDIDNVPTVENIFESQWFYEDTKYELFNNKETVGYIEHGL